MKFTHISKKQVFKNDVITVFEEKLGLPNNNIVTWTFTGKKEVVAIIAEIDGEIIFVKQYRPAIKKELLEMSEKNEKLDIYFKNWMEIVKYFYLIDVYKDYKNTFLDENNNFIETDESEINKFLSNLSEVDFENLDNAIQKLKSEIEKNPKYEKADKLMEDWVKSLVIWKSKLKEIQEYYESKEYKKDNFSKGKKLNTEYLKNVEIQEKRAKNIAKFNFKSRYLPEKEIIMETEKEYGKDFATINLLKLNVLFEIFYNELNDWKIVDNSDADFNILAGNKYNSQYLKKLKKIQSEIIRILEEIKEKKYNFNTSEVSIDKKMYSLVVGEYQKELKLLNEIISDIENNNYEKVNENNFILKRQNLEIGDTIIKLTIKEEK